jgi:hypothetical protein
VNQQIMHVVVDKNPQLFPINISKDFSIKAIYCFFLCFASVQNCETYPPARRKNKQALKNKVVFACCMDVKQHKFYLPHLSTKEILNKEYKYKIIVRIIENIAKFCHSQHS